MESLFPELFRPENVPGVYSVKFIALESPLAPVSYCFAVTKFGHTCIAENAHGICAMSFGQDKVEAAAHVLKRFPRLPLVTEPGHCSAVALELLQNPFQEKELSLAVHGTTFQKLVWQALTHIGFGRTESYGMLANRLNVLKGARAVGTAAGANPVAFFIPCHRLVNATGTTGEYRWGASRKVQLLLWEKEMIQSVHQH